jgi:hypothetical protein
MAKYGLLPILLIAALGGLLIYFLTAQSGSAMAVRKGGSVVASNDVPSSLLTEGPTGRPVCSYPLEPCIKGGCLNGVFLGDRAIYAGSYLPPTYFNTGAFTTSCGENPQSC